MAEPADIARQYLEAWNRRDWETFRSVLHPEFTYMSGDGQVQDGPDAGVAVGQMWATAFPDGKIEISRAVSCGDLALLEFVARGTNTGPLLGIPPTGKPATIYVCNVAEIRDGKILNEHEYVDSLAVMVQLGLVQDPTAANV